MCGALVTIIISPLLSHLSFNSNNYTLSFIFLSVVVLLNGKSNVNLAIIQGSHNIKALATANISGSLVGFIISVPLYYFLGTKSIVISIILTAIVLFLISNHVLKSLKYVTHNVSQNYRESWRIGLISVRLGIMISISFIVLTIFEFIIKTYITRKSGVDTVGFYQAGWTLNTTYLGMVFTAMATDFYPRLSMHANSPDLVKRNVNQQAEIALLILGPMIVIMIVSLPLLIRILYSMKFLNIIEMTRLFLFGSLLKAGSWTISFIFLAKGNGKLYLFNELGVKLITLPIYLILFSYMGLKGIGYAFIIDQSIYLVWVSLVAWIKYRFIYSLEFFRILLIILSVSLISLLGVYEIIPSLTLFISISCAIIITAYSIFKLNQKIEFFSYLKQKVN
jgi:O-antigen/teichoic acid export membrane protein